MKKFLLLALFCGFLATSVVGCGGEPTKAPAGAKAPTTGAAPATGAAKP
jgi:hypothetical protein